MNISHSMIAYSPTTSSHIINGCIPFSVDDDVAVTFDIKDIEFFISKGLSIDVDTKKWQVDVLEFKKSVIENNLRDVILHSLQVTDIFFYFSEDKEFEVNKEMVKSNVSEIIKIWNESLFNKLQGIEKKLDNLYIKSNKDISVLENRIEISNDSYNMVIKDKYTFYNVLENYIDKYFDGSIAFLENRESSNIGLSITDFKRSFQKVFDKEKPTYKDILNLIESTCFLLNANININ